MRIENTIFFLILHQIYVRNTNFFKQNCTIRILIGQFGTHLRQPYVRMNFFTLRISINEFLSMNEPLFTLRISMNEFLSMNEPFLFPAHERDNNKLLF